MALARCFQSPTTKKPLSPDNVLGHIGFCLDVPSCHGPAMQLLRYLTPNSSSTDAAEIGVQQGDRLISLRTLIGPETGMRELIEAWEAWSNRITEFVASGPDSVPTADARILAPLADPRKVICIGLNYADHAAETGAAVPTEPVVFNKFPTTVIGPDDAVELPPISSQVDYEAELVVVIGRRAKRIAPTEAMDCVFGYTCGNDISARDWQKGRPGGQWLLGKTFDTFAPLGPAIVTRDEIADPHQLDVKLRLNGETMQDSNTRQFIFQIDFLISHLSHVFTLEPGDLLFTGTPPGVGVARKPPVFLKHGDRVEVEIGGLGVLANPVVSAGSN